TMQLLLLEEGHCFRDQALSFCAMRPSEAHGLEGTSLATLVQMVAAGLGVTLIPEMAVGVETRAADVDVVRLEAPQPTRRIGMLWREGSPFAQDLAEVAAAIGRAAESVVDHPIKPLASEVDFSA
ncbi:MAG: LysR substrate-binding domain-containing protein, partial [Pseudomonadota bacterium]